VGLTPHIWYAGYGSNLHGPRLTAYLSGGRPDGSTRDHAGARDPRPPTETVTCSLPGRLAFRGRSSSWGDGGVAFWDATPDGVAGGAWCRAYRLRPGQLVDVAVQENARDPRDLSSAELADLERRLGDLVEASTSTGRATLDLGGPYDLAVGTRTVSAEGRTLHVVTLTCSPGRCAPVAPPPLTYVAVLLAGLTRDVGLAPAEARTYLAAAGVDRRTLDRAAGAT
jgi:hypothetical protein